MREMMSFFHSPFTLLLPFPLPPPPHPPVFLQLWRSDNLGSTWQLVVASAPWAPRSDHAMVAVGSSLWLLHGRGAGDWDTLLAAQDMEMPKNWVHPQNRSNTVIYTETNGWISFGDVNNGTAVTWTKPLAAVNPVTGSLQDYPELNPYFIAQLNPVYNPLFNDLWISSDGGETWDVLDTMSYVGSSDEVDPKTGYSRPHVLEGVWAPRAQHAALVDPVHNRLYVMGGLVEVPPPPDRKSVV